MEQTLAGLGEGGLLRRILTVLPTGAATLLGPGDDAALVSAADGRVVVSTDVLVEGRDFRRDWSSAADVGWKAAAQNMADVAAMGAAPTALLVSLAAPPGTEVAWALGLCEGLADACAGTGVGVVGGDLSGASEIVVAVTALGDLRGRDPVRRNGARPGDVVALAGPVGRSAAGLALLEAGWPHVAPDLVAAHRRPTPPYAAGLQAADAGATAMIDVSDGLVRDVARVADASGVTVNLWDAEPAGLLAVLRRGVLPAAEQLRSQPAAALLAREWVLTGGEDHALVACFGRDAVLPATFTVVGEVLPRIAGWPAVVLDGDGTLDGPGGWDHFGG